MVHIWFFRFPVERIRIVYAGSMTHCHLCGVPIKVNDDKYRIEKPEPIIAVRHLIKIVGVGQPHHGSLVLRSARKNSAGSEGVNCSAACTRFVCVTDGEGCQPPPAPFVVHCSSMELFGGAYCSSRT